MQYFMQGDKTSASLIPEHKPFTDGHQWRTSGIIYVRSREYLYFRPKVVGNLVHSSSHILQENNPLLTQLLIVGQKIVIYLSEKKVVDCSECYYQEEMPRRALMNLYKYPVSRNEIPLLSPNFKFQSSPSCTEATCTHNPTCKSIFFSVFEINAIREPSSDTIEKSQPDELRHHSLQSP